MRCHTSSSNLAPVFGWHLLQAYRNLLQQHAPTVTRIGASTASPVDNGEDQADLECWHRVEEKNPNVFGRMHIIFAQKEY